VDDGSPSLRRFLIDLVRRRVVRFTGLYAVGTVLLLEVLDALTTTAGLSPWTLRIATVVALGAFPLAVGIVWVFDWTPEGVRRTEPMSAGEEAKYAPGPAGTIALRLSTLSVLSLAVGAFVWYLGGEPRLEAARVSPLPVAADPSVAVLPLDHSDAGPDTGDFATLVHERLIEGLARTQGLRVASPSSVLAYRGAPRDLREIGRELGVATLVEGSLERAGERLLVRVRLVRAATGERLWGDVYELEDLTEDASAEVATHILSALQLDSMTNPERLDG